MRVPKHYLFPVLLNSEAGLMALGNVVLCERRAARGNMKVFPLKVEASVGRATRDLNTFHHLSYVLELSRNLAYDMPLEQSTFDLVLAYLGYLDEVSADGFRLLTWQLAVFDSIGMSLSTWPCVVSGVVPNGFSLEHGILYIGQANAHRVSSKANPWMLYGKANMSWRGRTICPSCLLIRKALGSFLG